MIVYVDDGRLILEPRAQLVARIQRAARAARTEHGSVVEELIADRRAEATRKVAGPAASHGVEGRLIHPA
jgi:hypothetical protein